MKTLLLLLTASGLVFSQAVTSVIGRMTTPTGDPVSGSCTLQAIGSFSTRSGGTFRIVGAPVTVKFTAGAFSALLVPTDATTPAGQYYKVSCAVPKQTVNGRVISDYSWGPRYWLVPNNSVVAVDIADVEVALPAPPPATVLFSQVRPPVGIADGTYCMAVNNGVVTGLVQCNSNGSSTQTWGGLESRTFAQLENSTWGQLENGQ